MTNNEKKEWLQRYRECWAEVEIHNRRSKN